MGGRWAFFWRVSLLMVRADDGLSFSVFALLVVRADDGLSFGVLALLVVRVDGAQAR